VPTPPWGSGGGGGEGPNPRRLAAVGLLLAAVMAGLALVALALVRDYLEERGRPGSTALEMEENTYSLRYVANRLRLYVQEVGGVGSSLAAPELALTTVVNRIIEEEVLHRFADELGIEVSPEEVDQAIRSRLGLSEPTAEGEQDPFPELYRRELERTGLSDEEYRAMVEGELLRKKAQSHFYDQTPTTAESVRFRRIVLRGPADPVVQRLEQGEDFAQVAREVSLDQATKAQGGEVGWMPRGLLDPGLEEALFSLQVGQVGQYSDPQSGLTYVLQVEEKDPARALEPPERQALADRALQRWLEERRSSLHIVNRVDPTFGDRDKVNWILKEVYG